MFKKRFLSLCVALLMLLSLSACQTDEGTSSAASPSNADTAAKPVKDRAGNDITVPDTVEKIIVLAPSSAQVICELGLTDKIIACDTQTPSYTTGLKEGIPQFDLMQPDMEKPAPDPHPAAEPNNRQREGSEVLCRNRLSMWIVWNRQSPYSAALTKTSA